MYAHLMKKRAFIIHGWEAAPHDHWFPWLAAELEKCGWEARTLAMPGSAHPEMDAWTHAVAEAVGMPDAQTVLIGHSIGAMAIMRYLESLPEGTYVAGAIFVAGFLENIDAELASFFRSPLDAERIRRTAGKIIAIASDDDQHTPEGSAELIRDQLGAELVVVPGAGHFNAEDGCATLPQALEAIIGIIP